MSLIRNSSLVVFLFVIMLLAGTVNAGVEPEENDWAKFNFAGFTLGIGSTKGKIKVGWTFILQLKKNNIKSIKIYDITDDEILLIDDNQISTKDGKWVGSSESIEVEKGSDHWLFSSDDTVKNFKLIMIDSNGDTSELIQETEHTGQNKAMTLMVLM